MSDWIDRQAAIDAIDSIGSLDTDADREYARGIFNALPSAQPDVPDTNVGDMISRQAAIAAADRADYTGFVVEDVKTVTDEVVKELKLLPSVQPTLYGYNIEHLELIARVLQKEDLPPERVVEALTDIGRIVAIVKDEFEEALKKEVWEYGRDRLD